VSGFCRGYGYSAAPIRERSLSDLSNADETVVHVPTGSSHARGGEDYGLDTAYLQKGHDELDVSDDEDVEYNPGSSPQDSSPGRDLNGTHRKKKKQIDFEDRDRSPDRVRYPSLSAVLARTGRLTSVSKSFPEYFPEYVENKDDGVPITKATPTGVKEYVRPIGNDAGQYGGKFAYCHVDANGDEQIVEEIDFTTIEAARSGNDMS
jgi:hypothetical protein